MHSYVINLARSGDRRAHMMAELDDSGLYNQFVTAVDGRRLDLSDPSLVDVVSLSNWSEFPDATVGTVLSHLSVYRKVIEEGRDAALVLEDDVMLPPDIAELADAVAKQLTGAEVALLNYDSETVLRLSTEGSVPLPGGRRLVMPIDVGEPRSGAAYMITREACERLLETARPIRVNPDDWWHFFREGVIDRVRCVSPLPVRKAANFPSTQGSRSLGNGLRYRLVWPLVNMEIPVVREILTYRRRHIMNRWTRSELVDMPFIEKPSRLD